MDKTVQGVEDPNQSQCIPELVFRLAECIMKQGSHNYQEGDLQKLKLKAVAVLKEYQGFEGSNNTDLKRLELLSATLQLHQSGRSVEADQLLDLSDKLSEVRRWEQANGANEVPAGGEEVEELPFQTHEPILHLLLSLQGSAKPLLQRGRSASGRSGDSRLVVDPFSQRLRSMHDHVGHVNRRMSEARLHDSSCSSRPDSQPGMSPALDNMLSAMRSTPCWDAGTPGSGRQAAPSKAAIGAAGASLLYHMDAQPDASRAAWQFSNPDGEASRADNDMQNGHSVNGAQANGVSGSSDHSGVDGKVEADSERGDWPLSASWGHQKPHKMRDTPHVVNEGQLAYELLLALQGIVPAILRLDSGQFQTESLSQASLLNLLRPSIQSGVLRANLDTHLSKMTFQAMSGPAPDPCLQAFAAAAIEILREQSVALQSVAESVRLRRKADLQNSIRGVTPGSLRHHLACVGVTAAADDDLTVLEVTVHTRTLQAQLRALATVCGLNSPGARFSGAELLDHLHANLEAADDAAAPLLRRLLLAAYRPYAEQLEGWLFRPATCLPRSSAFCAQLPAHFASLLPKTASAQAVPCSVPAFLQAWQGQVLLAGLHLRVLHCMPAPLDRLATGLADIAAAEKIPTDEESHAEPLTGAENFSKGMTAKETVAMPLTFHRTELTKIVAAQDTAILEREAFISSQLAEAAAAAKREGVTQSRHAGFSPEGARNSKFAAHEPAFLGTMRVLTAASPSRPQQCTVLPPASSPASTDSMASISRSSSSAASVCRSDSSEASSADSSPGEPVHSLKARMGALPDLGAPQPSALEMTSANGVSMNGHGPRLPKPWMLGRQNGAPSRAAITGPACDSECDSDDEEETVPLGAAVEACIVRRVLSQYACTGSACIRCLEHLGLGEALAALERYAFMGAGDWAAALVQQLADASISVEVPGPHDLHRMLDATVLASSAADDPCSAALSLRPGRSHSALITQRRHSAVLGLQLGMDVRWPLSIVISQGVIAQYNEVFGVLLELRMMSLQLQRLWLESVHRHGLDDRAWVSAATLQRVKELRSFRTAAAQLLDAVQGYMYAQLHSTSLSALLQDIKGSRDLLEAQAAVSRYLSGALHACLLDTDMQHSAELIAPVLQAICDCLAATLPALRSTDGNLVEAVMSERLWQRMHVPLCAFNAHMRTLVSQSKQSADQEVLQCVLAYVVVNDHWVKE